MIFLLLWKLGKKQLLLGILFFDLVTDCIFLYLVIDCIRITDLTRFIIISLYSNKIFSTNVFCETLKVF